MIALIKNFNFFINSSVNEKVDYFIYLDDLLQGKVLTWADGKISFFQYKRLSKYDWDIITKIAINNYKLKANIIYNFIMYIPNTYGWNKPIYFFLSPDIIKNICNKCTLPMNFGNSLNIDNIDFNPICFLEEEDFNMDEKSYRLIKFENVKNS